MTDNTPLFVTRSFLPPLEEFQPYLEKIWKSRVLTNCGPFHTELEEALCEYLGVPFISLVNNGTTALQIAIQALELTGEVITTPYSFVATAHAIALSGLEPTFVDIGQSVFNIDPTKIEAAITPRTSAILPVHCYGRPCDVDAIEEIAKKNGLKVLYDAAHAFGVNCHCGSVLNHGDLSILSFHATKVFNTLEGGAIISNTAEMKRRIDNLKNFGIVDEITVARAGLNGKMNEVSAALGLLQIKYLDEVVAERREIHGRYVSELGSVSGITIPPDAGALQHNYSSFPILIEDDYGCSRDELYERMKSANVFSRRYFYPLITDFPMYRDSPSAMTKNLTVAAEIAERVLCLPIYPGLSEEDVARIIGIVRR